MRCSRAVQGLCVSVAAVLFASSVLSAEPALLRRAYKAGDRYAAVMSSNQSVSQTSPDGTVSNIKQTQSTEMTLEVLEVGADGSAKAKVTYQRIAFALESPTLKLDYDSTDPAKKDVSHPILNVSKVLAGRSITAVISDRGEASGIQGIDEIIDGVLTTIPAWQNRDAMKTALKNALNEDSFKQQLSIFGVPLPAEAKGVGDSWSWDQNVSLGFVQMTVHNECKVAAMTDATVDLEVVSTMKLGQAVQNITVTLDPASRNAGKAALQRANAGISTGNSTSSIAMDIASKGQTFKSRTTGTSTVTVIKQ